MASATCYKDDPNLLRSERKAYFLENYFFDCQCEKCSDENRREEVYERDCVKCPNCGGGVAIWEKSQWDPVKCNKCQTDMPPLLLSRYWFERAAFKDLAFFVSVLGAKRAVYSLTKGVKSLFFPTEKKYLKILRKYFTTSEVCAKIVNVFFLIYC